MTADEARELAQKVMNRWRGTDPATAWATTLEPLDHEYALSTFRFYAQTEPDPGPTMHQFTERVRSFTPTASAPDEPRLTREERIALLTAAGAGWLYGNRKEEAT